LHCRICVVAPQQGSGGSLSRRDKSWSCEVPAGIILARFFAPRGRALCSSPVSRYNLFRAVLAMALVLFSCAASASAQGTTTGIITGVVLDAQKRPVSGASVVAIHLPSGTPYETVTREDGRFIIPNMRIGGPYSVVVGPNPGGLAFQPQTQDNITVNLGNATDLSFSVQPMVKEEVTVSATTDPVFNSER